MNTRVSIALVLSIAFAGCASDDARSRGGSTADGGTLDGDTALGDGSTANDASENGDAGGMQDDCAEEARWIYLIDSDSTLIRFEPDAKKFTEIGRIDCDSGIASPFSMAVDRDANAWVLHDDGNIFKVSTADASCSGTAYQENQKGFELFGMGFVSDTAGSSEETLFVAGGAGGPILDTSAGLASIDTASLVLSEVAPIGTLAGWPELTGTGNAELWAFFPETDNGAEVHKLNKDSGATLGTFPIDGVGAGTAEAWAFAFWGGRFYIFLKTSLDDSTHVWRLDPITGDVTEWVPNTGYRIVGAGVSTCAPVVLI